MRKGYSEYVGGLSSDPDPRFCKSLLIDQDRDPERDSGYGRHIHYRDTRQMISAVVRARNPSIEPEHLENIIDLTEQVVKEEVGTMGREHSEPLSFV